jgi:hypothetical protein
MMQLRNNWLLILAGFLFFFVTIPLYFFQYNNEAFISFALIILYLWIDMHINLLYTIGEKLKYSRMTMLFSSFFGLKNAYFIAFFILFFQLGYLHSFNEYMIVVVYYLLFSIALAKKVLNKSYVEIK